MRHFQEAVMAGYGNPVEGVHVEEIVQDDGARWHFFEDARATDRHYLIVTSVGREMIHGHMGLQTGEVFDLFDEYRATRTDSNGDMHQFLGEGQQAKVFGMGSEIAVREEKGIRPLYASLSTLTVMDRLSSVVEGGLPRWLTVPHYYAHYVDPRKRKQYTLMERIDSGLTVEDVLGYPNTKRPIGDVRVHREMGQEGVDPEQKATIEAMYYRAEDILRAVIKAKGEEPDDLLLDWKPRNVLVERLRTPVAGENFQLSIIDQNPST